MKKNPRWRPIFTGKVSFDTNSRSPWDYIINCFLTDQRIPEYFYAHLLTLPKKVSQQLKRQGLGHNLQFKVLELQFDCYNNEHLLVYTKVLDQVYLVAVGTHSDLF